MEQIDLILKRAKEIDPDNSGAMSSLEALIADYNDLTISYHEIETITEYNWEIDGGISGHLSGNGKKKLNRIIDQLTLLTEKKKVWWKKLIDAFKAMPKIISLASIPVILGILYTTFQWGVTVGEKDIKYDNDLKTGQLQILNDSLSNLKNTCETEINELNEKLQPLQDSIISLDDLCRSLSTEFYSQRTRANNLTDSIQKKNKIIDSLYHVLTINDSKKIRKVPQ